MSGDERVRSLGEAEQHIRSLSARLHAAEKSVSDHEQRFDTLQTRWWKGLWFRIDGWPGRVNLNAAQRAWRPWH